MTDEQPPNAPPEKPWPVWANAYLEALRRQPSVSRAAETAGIDRRTVHRLVQRDERFAVAQLEAREQALDLLEEVIYARATRGMPVKKTVTRTLPDGKIETTVTEEQHISDTLAMFYLKRWRPEYRESYTVEQHGSVTVKVDAEALDRHIAGLLEDLGPQG